jgi:hypothetical protein
MIRPKPKKPFRNAHVNGGKARYLREQKEKAGDMETLDQFIDDNTALRDPDGEYQPAPARRADIREELEHLEGFRDFLEESRGNNLTYGDY